MDALSAFLLADFLGKPAWIWLSFIAIVVTLLALDLGEAVAHLHRLWAQGLLKPLCGADGVRRWIAC